MDRSCQDCGQPLRSATAARCRPCNARTQARERAPLIGAANPNWKGGTKVGPHACKQCSAVISWLTARRSGLCRRCAHQSRERSTCERCGAQVSRGAAKCKRCWQSRPVPAYPGLVCQCCGGRKAYYADQCRACLKQKTIQEAACIDCGMERSSRQKGRRCRSCHLAFVQQRSASKPDLYGLTRAERAALEAAQGGVCAICGDGESAFHQSGTKRRLCVDHDHHTGRVRGLLCNRCNIMLGRVNDDIEVLRRAIAYLERGGTVNN